jgi:hypothetical protein
MKLIEQKHAVLLILDAGIVYELALESEVFRVRQRDRKAI